MKGRVEIGDTSVPHLPRHVKFRFDETRKQWLLLAPERVLMPDEIAVEILKLCDGQASVSAIADGLAAKFSAPRDVVGRDVTAMLQDLADKGFMEA
ncbi:MAG TPA: pyrroloquinoline quinone biosynthesis peptide chaperone PqqD [Candidatus Cybelea sp.]|nr:pyrroloquinoline quinone biosynthesis peptide chaperone PqqD [Candidatus Cybelea sp.]